MVYNSVFVPSPAEGGGAAVMVSIIQCVSFSLCVKMHVPFINWLYVMLLTAVQGRGK